MTEDELYDKIVQIKNGYDKLYVIKEELDDLIKLNYDEILKNPLAEGLISSYKEFIRWENEQRRKEKTDS